MEATKDLLGSCQQETDKPDEIGTRRAHTNYVTLTHPTETWQVVNKNTLKGVKTAMQVSKDDSQTQFYLVRGTQDLNTIGLGPATSFRVLWEDVRPPR